ncbi:hypothetical protein CRENBAI_018398 [Crenichthys baileyi]|uniref:Uncharacterized protein n=1 Tax=Crenichthys baileyi TaxID=28760 RepID=A0AAV9QXU9_9TELE
MHRIQRLFVHYRQNSAGKLLSPECLSQGGLTCLYLFWIGPSSEAQSPLHQGIPSSTALHGGMTEEDICTAAYWSSPCLLINFKLDISSLSHLYSQSPDRMIIISQCFYITELFPLQAQSDIIIIFQP